MTTQTARPRSALSARTLLPTVTIFLSASLVFLVQPMVAKLLLPLMGGSPAVWNTSLAFFQIALLAGYVYAHLLQRIDRLGVQLAVHGAVLLMAALVLPLRLWMPFGDPDPAHPVLWLLLTLTLSVGAPFAALSATAPLVQAWTARSALDHEPEPWGLYAASNVGSLLALLSYPALIEPLSRLSDQRLGWSFGFGLFVIVILACGLARSRTQIRRPAASQPAAIADSAPRPGWRQRLTWMALAAVPSSLMMGVTTHITTDIASAPFLWVLPLGLYLLTFVIVFQDRPVISKNNALLFHAAAFAGCMAILPFRTQHMLLQLAIHLASFFFAALVCHQAMVARRPRPVHLTEFYLWMSVGGTLGGIFNAFVAPVIFTTVLEYPLALVAAVLARPFGERKVSPFLTGAFLAGLICAALAVVVLNGLAGRFDFNGLMNTARLLLAVATVCIFLMRGQALYMAVLGVVVLVAASAIADRVDVKQVDRSFFGVMRISETPIDGLGGTVRMFSHGTTLHGAQAQDPRYRCRPLVYYAPETPIGQVLKAEALRRPQMTIGAVGLGTGAVATYTRPGDRLTFFEIDPLVVRIASDPKQFSYTSECARGQIAYVTGDARLTLASQPDNSMDVLLIDAFSSDSVPAHLLTVEAIGGYLTKLKPDGILILHLSNRHLELKAPAMAAVAAAGGTARLQRYPRRDGVPRLWESAEDVVIGARSAQSLANYDLDPRWVDRAEGSARAWTDDYTNLIAALLASQKAAASSP